VRCWSGARNLGVEAARGELIAFQDSDDVWLPHKLAAQVAALDSHPKAGLCYCGSVFSAGTVTYYIPATDFTRYEGDMSREILRRNTTSTQTLVIRRSALQASGLFDASLKRFQDWDLMIRVAQVTEFVFLPEPMALIFATPGNISSVVINDALSRAAILEKYPALFAANPAHSARNHYITGRVWQKLGEPAKARPHLARAFALRPGPRSAVQMIRALFP
jgi:glycosyltransferase involved in cell wall biosynthesis